MKTPVRLLHIEDSPVERGIILNLLHREAPEFLVTGAECRSSLEARLAEDNYDVVLSDFHLPDIDGLEILALVQARHANLPVVFISRTASEDLAVEALKRGADDYVTKSPIHLERLPFALRTALERHRLLGERERTEARLRSHVRHQAAVAELSQLALTGAETEAVLNKSVSIVAETLHVEFAKVLELSADGSSLWLRAGVGWQEGLVGRATVPAGLRSQAGYTLRSRQPVIVEELQAETRFSGPPLLIDHGVVSGVSVVIESRDRPFGVLGAHTAKRRAFAEDEVHFLQLVAGVLAAAVERKQTEEALRTERDLLQALMDNIPDTIYFKDAQCRFTRINRAQARVLGLSSPPEALGKTDSDFFNPEHAQAAFADEQEILASGQPVVDKVERLRWPNGQWHWVSATKVPIKDQSGRIQGLVGISRDITERVAGEQRIREQAVLLDCATDAILVCDLEGRIRFWNKGAERLYGWAAQEAVGRNEAELLFAGTPAELEEARRSVLEKGAWSGELRQATKAGSDVIVEGRWTLIRDAEGKPKSELIINTDITERKKLETQFLRTQRLECLGVLAGGVAHDLNNALTPIHMAVELLLDKQPDEDSMGLLRLVRDSCERAGQMVQQILAFSRGTGGKRIDLQVEHLIKSLQKIALDTFPKTIEVHVCLPKGLWAVSGDPTQLHQVLLNLCLNARDAMPRGGSLTIGAENAELDAQYVAMSPQAHVGSYTVISVEDTGEGMPKEVTDRLFEPFFTTKEVGKGTGLGLSTSLGIVKNHGGFIKVASTSPKGSTFKVYLPAVRGSDAESAFREAGEMPEGHGELLLVVDDEQPVRTICQQTLEAHGYRVLPASDGAEAVALYSARRTEVAAVLADMLMPVLPGPQMVNVLRRLNPAVKVIGMSGRSAEYRPLVEARGLGGALTKPFTARELLDMLAEVLKNQPDTAAVSGTKPS